MREHLDQVRDLAVGAENLGAFDDADGMIGKLLLKLADSDKGGVAERADAEQDLVFAGVVLAAMAGEGGVHLVIEAADRLQDADGGCVGGARVAEVVDKGAGAPEGDKVVADAGPGEDGGDAGDDGGYEGGVQGFEFSACRTANTPEGQ